MQSFKCVCQNTLFFDSVQCVECHTPVGLCPACRRIAAMWQEADGAFRCRNTDCGAILARCLNGVQHGVCNAYLLAGENQPFCAYCRLNSIIPDLSVDGNVTKWSRLEAAKRRVLYGLAELGYPFEEPATSYLPLSFAFKADDEQPVATGHFDGCVTINVREADDVERERARVQFGEPQRTLVGHFRHELGHYYWQLMVEPNQLEGFRRVFGDETNPTYQAAQSNYYVNGPADNWQDQYISAYASMHAWEDFAETFASYLDMRAIVKTAQHFGANGQGDAEFEALLEEYRRIGIVANELNRDMGLTDLLPEVLTPVVVQKLSFIHGLPVSNV